MTKRTDLAAQAAKVSGARTKTATTAADGGNGTASLPRVKPMRLTLDLAPNQYKEFGAACRAIADKLGEGRVPGTQVLRALVAELIHNEQLQATITEAVRQQRS